MKRGFALGGEQSGHVIFSEHLFTGDGLATALNVLRIMADTGKELSELAGAAGDLSAGAGERARQAEDRSHRSVPAIADARCRRSKQGLAGNGRLLVRYSGTEPLLRIMLEGQGRRGDSRLGRRDRRRRQRAPGVTVSSRESTVKSSGNSGQVLRQRQQGGDRAQLARRAAAVGDRSGARRASMPARRASRCIRAPTSGTSRSRTCTRSPTSSRRSRAASSSTSKAIRGRVSSSWCSP